MVNVRSRRRRLSARPYDDSVQQWHGRWQCAQPRPDLFCWPAAPSARSGEKGTPIANLLVHLLDMAGVAADSIGDSTGKLEA